ncbi:MAG: response regulator [Treponema sp.]|uniref:response regulator n=1 Tax=Treponema sp. TaxID=166 RepID=UPI0025E95F81|nr:response regulator [Treponema sp.]MBQ8678674.1 response regulator [Treponema sp.]
MKSVLVVDAPQLLRDFLTEKLSSENVAIEPADGQRDALPKFLSLLPDLVIIYIENSVSDMMDFLSKKQADPNGKKTPIIIAGPLIDQDEVSDLVQYGVIKYFTRPIKFDLFFESIGRVLHSDFSIDTTPCVMDIHLNRDIIFIELAVGLNREKITLLKYKLTEIIENNNLSLPKIILMMSSLSLSYVDGLNLELLLSNITEDRRILRRNIKILTLDSFVSDFISGHPTFDGIQVVSKLSEVLNSLVGARSGGTVEELISDNLLSASDSGDSGLMATRFFSDTGTVNENEELTTGQVKIAIVDNDLSVARYLKQVSEAIGDVTVFTSCRQFVSTVQQNQFNLAIMGMYMAELTGLDILKALVEKKIDLPVIIYSNVVQKEVIMQALKLGASSYLIKPQPLEVITQKALEIINAKRQF